MHLLIPFLAGIAVVLGAELYSRHVAQAEAMTLAPEFSALR